MNKFLNVLKENLINEEIKPVDNETFKVHRRDATPEEKEELYAPFKDPKLPQIKKLCTAAFEEIKNDQSLGMYAFDQAEYGDREPSKIRLSIKDPDSWQEVMETLQDELGTIADLPNGEKAFEIEVYPHLKPEPEDYNETVYVQLFFDWKTGKFIAATYGK